MGNIVNEPTPPKGRVFANYAVSRKQKREIARNKMKAEGKKQVCKHSHRILEINHAKQDMIIPSYFAEHWREFV